MSLFLQVVVVGLGGWRLASLLVREDGPADIFLKIRDRAGIPQGTGEMPDTFAAGVLSCIWCCSVFTTTALWLLALWLPEVAAIPAAWAVAIAADRYVR